MRDDWQTREECPHCGVELDKFRYLPIAGMGLNYEWKPSKGNYLTHQPDCPLLCDFPGCFASTTAHQATCAEHHPTRLAEVAERQAERNAHLAEQRGRHDRRQQRSATGSRRRQLKADYGRPLTMHSLLSLTVAQFAAVEMLATELQHLQGSERE